MSEGGMEDYLHTKLICDEFNKRTFKMKLLERELLKNMDMSFLIYAKDYFMTLHGGSRTYDEQGCFFKDYMAWLDDKLYLFKGGVLNNESR